ncbi:MAG: phosphatidylglycerol lysyltransferase domain-containing protein [Treponema sp.]|nr:phosphatidylglycerol lysyltransferase domain-containing protein [Treponema sp.]MCL2272586.1 phosphatidylglycerol lysyltransferase domain-containing protein [Treponema sp.]
MKIPDFPDFIPLDVGLKEVLHPRLSLTPDGVSEFTFSGLYLFRNKYNYRISRCISPDSKNESFIISGEQNGKTFFMTPCTAPDFKTLEFLFKTHDYWKNISNSVLIPVVENLEKRGIVFHEDRDNFDYLYFRTDLAELSGKKYHKKKNHVNHFLHSYLYHRHEPITGVLIPHAIDILDRWRLDSIRRNGEEGDYKAAKESLELFDFLALKGLIFYIDEQPAAFCLGESLARGKMFVTHFEKAIDEYKGIYQYVNQAFAASLPGFFTLINREQDLGNEGMRQAKMTYRPCGFVQKYKAEGGSCRK